jgi:hypothetical protein
MRSIVLSWGEDYETIISDKFLKVQNILINKYKLKYSYSEYYKNNANMYHL